MRRGDCLSKSVTSFLLALALIAGLASAASGAEADSAKVSPAAGAYCPGLDTLYLTLEELTVALRAVTQAQEAALVLGDAASADILLGRAGTALALASGRGSGARTATLIDAVIAAKTDANSRGMLPWFPNLKRSLAGLADDPTKQAAQAKVSEAEAIVQGQAQGDEVLPLRAARQLLVCDPLDIPLQQATTGLTRLHRTVVQGQKPTPADFSAITDLLNSASSYGLQRLLDLERP
jgi:hypothetical protein